jgi:hypothetical protein
MVAPPDPVAVCPIVPVDVARQVEPGVLGEFSAAVGAVADPVSSQARPTVVGEPVGAVALDDLAQHGGQVFLVVWAVHAGLVAVACPAWLARSVDGEPVGMCAVESLAGAVRVHARQHGEPFLACGPHDLAEQIPVAQVLGAVLQAEPAGIVGNNAAGVDHDTLCMRSSPVFAPPLGVVAGWIEFVQVGLSPAVGAVVPGHCGFFCHGRFLSATDKSVRKALEQGCRDATCKGSVSVIVLCILVSRPAFVKQPFFAFVPDRVRGYNGRYPESRRPAGTISCRMDGQYL